MRNISGDDSLQQDMDEWSHNPLNPLIRLGGLEGALDGDCTALRRPLNPRRWLRRRRPR